MTTYEREIYHLITGAPGHLTVEQLHAEMKKTYPRIVLATVYNNVNKLWRAGLIHKVSVENMPDRYDRAVKHDHLVCKSCGKLTDISLEDLTGALQGQLGESVLSYDLKVFYLCPDCRERAQSDAAKSGIKARRNPNGQKSDV